MNKDPLTLTGNGNFSTFKTADDYQPLDLLDYWPLILAAVVIGAVGAAMAVIGGAL